MVDLHAHEAGNGGKSQAKPTAPGVLLYSDKPRRSLRGTAPVLDPRGVGSEIRISSTTRAGFRMVENPCGFNWWYPKNRFVVLCSPGMVILFDIDGTLIDHASAEAIAVATL